MEASLPSASWRGKGSLGPVSRLLDWEREHFRGLTHWNLASALVSTHSAQVWPSPAPPVSIGAGVSGWEGPVTGASCMGGSSAGVSCGGAAVVPILGPLGPTTGLLANCTTPLETRLASAVATWAMVPQSNGGTPGSGLV